MAETYNLDVILHAKSTGMAAMKEAESSLKAVNLAAVGLAIGLGALIMGAKSMVERSRELDDAQLSLAQALGNSKPKLDALQASFDAWVKTNAKYIPDQARAELALAQFARAGNNAQDSMRLLNDALDISVIKHEDITDASKMLTLALAGNSRGLRFLGISTTDYNAIMKSHLTTAQKHHALLKLIEQKTKDGRKAQDDLAESSNTLKNHWDDLSKKGGPVITKLLDTVVNLVSGAYDWFDKIGKDDRLWSNISGRLVAMAAWIKQYILDPLQWAKDHLGWLVGAPGGPGTGGGNSAAGALGRQGRVGRQHGGEVRAYQAYTVGERGQETLLMGSQGGTIIPNGGGMDTNRDLVSSLDRLIALLERGSGSGPSDMADMYTMMGRAHMNRMRGLSGA